MKKKKNLFGNSMENIESDLNVLTGYLTYRFGEFPERKKKGHLPLRSNSRSISRSGACKCRPDPTKRQLVS